MHALVRVRALSAQEAFKDQYPQTLRWSVLGALVVLVIAILVMPEYRPTPYRLADQSTQLMEIEMEAPPIDEPRPQVIDRPRNLEPAMEDDPNVEDYPDIPPLIEVPPNTGPWISPAQDAPFVVASAKPRLLQGAVADYPEIARLAGMQGTVMLKVLVDLDGSVAQVEIIKGVHSLLDKSAVAAARKLLFTPGTQQKVPVRCWVAVPFRFYMH